MRPSGRFAARFPTQRGLTLMETLMTLVVAGILAAIAIGSLRGYGVRNRVKLEAGTFKDHMWDLRSMAVTGKGTPCVDFPDGRRYRLYLDGNVPRNGFTSGDGLIREVVLGEGISIQALTGGTAPDHFVCYESKGIVGSASQPLRFRIGYIDGGDAKVVEVLPATGMARVQ